MMALDEICLGKNGTKVCQVLNVIYQNVCLLESGWGVRFLDRGSAVEEPFAVWSFKGSSWTFPFRAFSLSPSFEECLFDCGTGAERSSPDALQP